MQVLAFIVELSVLVTMKRSINLWAITFAFILAFGYVNARIVKRDDGDDDDDSGGGLMGIVTGITDFSRELPIVGGLIGSGLDTIQGIYQGVQDATDGAVGRLLGGAFPCTISLEYGIVCTGDTINSKLSDLIKTLLDPIPGILLPEFVKNIILMLINLFIEPTLDVVFGGVPMVNGAA